MSFFERYLECCKSVKIDPSSQSTAELWGVNKGTISAWKKNGNMPKGDVIAKIADYFNVSADYLIGRTDQREGMLAINSHQILTLYSYLDDEDKKKAVSYIEFMLSDNKYQVLNHAQSGA